MNARPSFDPLKVSARIISMPLSGERVVRAVRWPDGWRVSVLAAPDLPDNPTMRRVVEDYSAPDQAAAVVMLRRIVDTDRKGN